jgi:putative membrane protein
MRGWMMDGWMGFGGMWFSWLPVIALVVAVVWFVARAARGSNHPSAQEVLDQRYARGEIGRDEYEHKRRDLRR